MFQTFSDNSDPTLSAPRVRALRQQFKKHGVDGYIVPRSDEYLGEYVPPHAERLAWLTGFTGSAGLAVILARKAAVFVDGRYTLQVRDQVDGEIFDFLQVPQDRPTVWIAANLKRKGRLGFDPRVHRMSEISQFKTALENAGIALVPLAQNLVDSIWEDQPPRPLGPVRKQALKHAGRTVGDKLADFKEALKRDGQDAAVVAASDSVSWLFNIRGEDIPHTPAVLAFAIIHARKKPELFIRTSQLPKALAGELKADARILAPDKLQGRLEELGAKGALVRLDPNWTPQWFADVLNKSGADSVEGRDPCILPKALKNAAEISGSREAHLRDGVAVTRFLHWLDQETGNTRAGSPSGVDEIAAVKALEALRAETGKLKDISFDTISGAGPNGAIVHYRVTEKTNAPLLGGSLFLLDSGGQYIDGTTDITRTLPVGKPTTEMVRHFTLVLKGHIGIANARFPEGSRGVDLDVLARAPLWAAGLDYDHGTGHGVGAYLSVHEGPQSLSKRGMVPLQPGMIISNEPGYYKEGAYGIRIENLVLVREPEDIEGGDRPMLGFETLTLAPIDRRLIDAGLLTQAERKWLNQYHVRVHRELSPHLSRTEAAWLKKMTASL